MFSNARISIFFRLDTVIRSQHSQEMLIAPSPKSPSLHTQGPRTIRLWYYLKITSQLRYIDNLDNPLIHHHLSCRWYHISYLMNDDSLLLKLVLTEEIQISLQISVPSRLKLLAIYKEELYRLINCQMLPIYQRLELTIIVLFVKRCFVLCPSTVDTIWSTPGRSPLVAPAALTEPISCVLSNLMSNSSTLMFSSFRQIFDFWVFLCIIKVFNFICVPYSERT